MDFPRDDVLTMLRSSYADVQDQRSTAEDQRIKEQLTKAALLSENRLCDRGEGSMALLMMICAAISGASGTMSGAGLAVGTADALDTFLLFLLDVKTRTAKDQNYNCNNKEVLHRQNHFFSAYSAAKD